MRSARPRAPALTRPDRPTLRITWHCSLGGILSLLLANIALSALDDELVRRWEDEMATKRQRAKRRQQGLDLPPPCALRKKLIRSSGYVRLCRVPDYAEFRL